jgi:hypothetical protein
MADEIAQGNELRRIQNAAMAGRELTPQQQALIDALMPEKMARSERLGNLGAELTMVPQVARTAGAIGDAVQDPSLANVTNAGMNAAITAFRPLTAAAILGGGYGIAGARDAGLLDMSANAQAPKGPQAPQIEGLTPQQSQELSDLQRKAQNFGWASGDDRRMGLKRIDELRGIANANANAENTARVQAEAGKKAAAQDEYKRMVTAAETARNAELARDRRFSDTEMGKVWDKTGGAAPLFAGAATGALTRALMSKGGAGAMKEYVAPAAIGAFEGAALSNLPLIYNSNYTEPDNPQKRAFEAYARELPPSHPRKGEYADYAKGLPDKNPVREVASDDLYDPWKAAERMGFGALEGGIGSVVGGKVGSGVRQGMEGLVDALMKPFSRAKPNASSSADPATQLRQVIADVDKFSGTRPAGNGPAPTPASPQTTSPPVAPSTDLATTLAGQSQMPASPASSKTLLEALSETGFKPANVYQRPKGLPKHLDPDDRIPSGIRDKKTGRMAPKPDGIDD